MASSLFRGCGLAWAGPVICSEREDDRSFTSGVSRALLGPVPRRGSISAAWGEWPVLEPSTMTATMVEHGAIRPRVCWTVASAHRQSKLMAGTPISSFAFNGCWDGDRAMIVPFPLLYRERGTRNLRRRSVTGCAYCSPAKHREAWQLLVWRRQGRGVSDAGAVVTPSLEAFAGSEIICVGHLLRAASASGKSPDQ